MAEDYQFKRKYIQKGGQTDPAQSSYGFDKPWAGWGWFIISTLLLLIVVPIVYFVLSRQISSMEDLFEQITTTINDLISKVNPAIDSVTKIKNAFTPAKTT